MPVIGLRELCTPAYVYFVISIFTVFIIAIQNLGDESAYCLGTRGCRTENKMTIFILKLVYIVFWTWLLNVICKSGHEPISWLLVLLPYVLMFVLIALIFIPAIPYDDGRYTNISILSFM
jgi:hypothetical protein